MSPSSAPDILVSVRSANVSVFSSSLGVQLVPLNPKTWSVVIEVGSISVSDNPAREIAPSVDSHVGSPSPAGGTFSTYCAGSDPVGAVGVLGVSAYLL